MSFYTADLSRLETQKKNNNVAGHMSVWTALERSCKNEKYGLFGPLKSLFQGRKVSEYTVKRKPLYNNEMINYGFIQFVVQRVSDSLHLRI